MKEGHVYFEKELSIFFIAEALQKKGYNELKLPNQRRQAGRMI